MVVFDLDIRVSDILQMKKPHPCSGREFLVMRAGMDFKLKCIHCGHEFMAKRSKIEKNIKNIVRKEL